MSLFTAVSLDWQTIVAHTKCYGDFQVRLSLTALSPLVLLALVFLIALGLSAWRKRRGGVRPGRARRASVPHRVGSLRVAHTTWWRTSSIQGNTLLESREAGKAGPSASLEPREIQLHTLVAPKAGEAGPSEPPERLGPMILSADLAGEAEASPLATRTKTGDKMLSQIISRAVLLALPTALVCTSIFLPSVAHDIFKAFDCEAFEYDDLEATKWCATFMGATGYPSQWGLVRTFI